MKQIGWEIEELIPNKFVAVIDRNIEKKLKEIGQHEKIARGEVKCAVCGKTITMGDISLIIPHDGEYLFVCDDFKCYVEALDRWA